MGWDGVELEDGIGVRSYMLWEKKRVCEEVSMTGLKSNQASFTFSLSLYSSETP